jgi:hypothetical protein
MKLWNDYYNLQALSPDEIVEFLKDADGTKPISRFASSGQLSTGRLSYSPEKPAYRGRTRSSSPVSIFLQQQQQQQQQQPPKKTQQKTKWINKTSKNTENIKEKQTT